MYNIQKQINNKAKYEVFFNSLSANKLDYQLNKESDSNQNVNFGTWREWD